MMLFPSNRRSMLSQSFALILMLHPQYHFIRPTFSQPSSSPQLPPPPFTVSELQESIRSSMIQNNNMVLNPILNGILQQVVATLNVSATTTTVAISTTNSSAAKSNSRAADINSLVHVNSKNEVLIDVVVISITTTTGSEDWKSVFMKEGYDIINSYQNTISMYLPVDQIQTLIDTIPEIVKVNLAVPIRNHQSQRRNNRPPDHQHLIHRHLQGSVTSQAVRAMYVDLARRQYSQINGTGITVGILSDSFDCQGNQARRDIRTGDLPPRSRIQVLADLDDETDANCIDEGRALMQLIYDIAPGVNFAFHTAARGEADFAAGILALANVGCQIIVDDIRYETEPFFQDGVVSLAIDEVVSKNGVSYFAAVGNWDNYAWDGRTGFVSSGIDIDDMGTFHSFGLDSDGNHIISQRFVIDPYDELVYLFFQWDEPFINPTDGSGGSRSDLDLYVMDDNGNVISTPPIFNIGGDPLEYTTFNPSLLATSDTVESVTVHIMIVLKEGPSPSFMKIIATSDGVFEFQDGSEGTAFGHGNSALGASVGAAYYQDTPAYGVSPPQLESGSSYGGTPILFDQDGNRLQVPEIRLQPRLVGPDGVSTTFFYDDNTFYGTSAAVAHVGGVAALILQQANNRNEALEPRDVYGIMESSAIDMTSTIGFDFLSGFGLVNTLDALNSMSCTVSWNVYNSQTNAFVAPIVGGRRVARLPPCQRFNIEAVFPSCYDTLLSSNSEVVIELYNSKNLQLISRRTETSARYFLFGNNGNDIYDGRIRNGQYQIRATLDYGKTVTPFTSFTIAGGCY